MPRSQTASEALGELEDLKEQVRVERTSRQVAEADRQVAEAARQVAEAALKAAEAALKLEVSHVQAASVAEAALLSEVHRLETASKADRVLNARDSGAAEELREELEKCKVRSCGHTVCSRHTVFCLERRDFERKKQGQANAY
jgi:hypothetical protein